MRTGAPSLGWSDFALERHDGRKGAPTFDGSPEELLELVAAHWAERQPGLGRTDLSQVVVVPVPPERFRSSVVRVDEATPLRAELHRRQEYEEPVLRVLATGGDTEPVASARVVLYSKDTLTENDGQRSTAADWEIVAVLASAREDEPMHPTTMARNFLERPGGTFAPYTAQQFAESIWYWAARAKLYVPDEEETS